MPQINARSQNIKRNEDVATHLAHDAEQRAGRKEQAAVKKAVDDAEVSRMNMVQPCSQDSKSIVYRAFESEF